VTTEAVFVAPATGVYYHYTSRSSAQEMSMAGQILLGRDGLIYLTDVLYRLGWQATDRLALPEKNAEVVLPIPSEVLPEPAQYRGLVPSVPTASGRSFRRGGGHQWVVTRPIRISILPWSWMPLEIP
jgi:hypothetical protein